MVIHVPFLLANPSFCVYTNRVPNPPCNQPPAQLSPMLDLPATVAELEWRSWEEGEVTECLVYLMGYRNFRVPDEWAAYVPSMDHLMRM